jgi:hypothetical protein
VPDDYWRSFARLPAASASAFSSAPASGIAGLPALPAIDTSQWLQVR